MSASKATYMLLISVTCQSISMYLGLVIQYHIISEIGVRSVLGVTCKLDFLY